MRLGVGTRLGNLEIVSGLGAGGMGEVYRARDTLLHRDVAVKVVRRDLCDQAESRARLRREARALAALNHPHIATIHGLTEVDDSCGLVMELVPGDTLAELLRRRRLKLDEVLRLGSQMAAALDAAHEHGLVHRDFKPANVKVTPEGQVKVLDFGLVAPDGGRSDAHETTVATEAGLVLGTAPYMSPEQVRGIAVDRRTDVWAFGCVLYEMLSGRAAFGGASRADILAAVLEREPDWAALPDEAPADVRRLVKRCLHKDPRRRLRDIGDARLELEDAAARDHHGTEPALADTMPVRQRRRAQAVALVVSGAAIGALAVAAWRPAPSEPGEIRFSIAVPDEERVADIALGALALSPDGRTLVYVSGRGASTELRARRVDAGTGSPLAGTAGATSPFFSPDGAWVGFFADGELKKVPIGGGPTVTLCRAPEGLGGAWSPRGTIVFASATGAPLLRVSDGGGTPVRVTTLDESRGEFSHRWPEFLPDGDTVLFTVGSLGEWDDADIVAQSLTSGRRTSILTGGTNPRYLTSGHLAYAHDRAIWIVPFDASRLTLGGSAAPALEQVSTSADGAAQFAVSHVGTVVFQPRAPFPARRLIVVDDSGPTPLAAPPHAFVFPRVSPDGRGVLVGVSDEEEHVWFYDLSTGMLRQLTFEASNRMPIWSADGRRATFASNRHGAMNLFTAPAVGEGPVERLTNTDALQLPGSWSPGGDRLAFVEQHPTTGRDIWLRGRNGTRTPWVAGDADESAPRFSPDGRRLAYVSNESGEPEVYIGAVDGPAPIRRVSTGGGTEPVWRRDGAALYFRSYGRLFEAPLGGGAPRVVFDGAAEPGTFDGAGYDVVGNTRRFLMISGGPPDTVSEMRVILNWRPAAGPSLSRNTAARAAPRLRQSP